MADIEREAWGILEFDKASRGEAMLLGRGTYEYFERAGRRGPVPGQTD